MLALAKFDELKTLLGLDKDSFDDYPDLKLLVSSVYSAIEQYLGRTLELGTYTEIVPIHGSLVPLPAVPLSSIGSVVTATGMDLTGGASIRHDGIALSGTIYGEVQVTYTGGLEAATPPLKRAALLQIQHEYQRKDHVGATTVSNEGGSTYWPELGLLKEVKRMLDPMMHPVRLF
jgi:hypothetical protein